MRIASLSLLALCLAVVPAMAQTVYSNGPINGNTDAWTVNFGFIVSDTFNVSNSGTQITGGSFGMWLFPGDTLTSAELSITSGENGGTSYFDQTVNFTQQNCAGNGFGFNVCTESTTFNGPTLNSGTYWLNLQNASVPSGDPIYWDENSGPSSASENSIGSIPSEAFTVLGTSTTTTSTTTTTTGGTSVPEPSSIMLFGSGILGLAGVLRRKLF
jgi:PEP-CTERM motif